MLTLSLDIDISDLNGNGMMVSANGTPVFVMPKSYAGDFAKKLEQIEAERLANKAKEEQEMQARNELAKELADEVNPTEQIIIKYMLKNPEGSSAMKIASALPRSISQSDLGSALKSLTERGVIVKSETGTYNINADYKN